MVLKGALFSFFFSKDARREEGLLLQILNYHNMASLVNGSFASPLADANMRMVTEGGWLAKMYNGMSGLNVLISFLLVLVAYDQCELHDANGC